MYDFFKIIKGVSIVAALLAMTACGGSSGGGPTTGQVAVIITDGPAENFDRVLITLNSMTLIGSGGQETIFDAEQNNGGEPITFDLLQLRDRADFAFSQEVAIGDYNKIRLEITGVTLVDLGDNLDDPADDDEVVLEKLPANGKIDLNPRGPFTIYADRATVVELDMDALRSFQVVETGNGGWRFRPVIFVNVSDEDIGLRSRLTRVFGTVRDQNLDDDLAPFVLLCDLQFAARIGVNSATDPDACVRVFVTDTGNFGETGVPFGNLADLANAIDTADPAPAQMTAIGFASLSDGAADDGAPYDIVLELDAVVTELGPRRPDADSPGWETKRGTIVTDRYTENCAAAQCVDFDPAAESNLVQVELQPEPLVYSRDGMPLLPDALDGQSPMVVTGAFDGWRADDVMHASLFIKDPDGEGTLIAGTLTAVMAEETYDILTVQVDDAATQLVCVYDDTDVLQILVDDEIITIVDLVDRTVLDLDPSAGLRVEVTGEPSSKADCDIDAGVVIVE